MRQLNDWTIIGEVLEDKRLWCLVRCKCGYEGKRRLAHLESGRTKRCKSCSAKQTHAEYPHPRFGPRSHEGEGDLGRTYWCTLQGGAKARGIDFEITLGYAWSLFNGKCALSGVPITLSSTVKNNSPDYAAFTASLDRKDSSLGYIEGNIQWVHRTVNRMKGELLDDALKWWCSKIVENISR